MSLIRKRVHTPPFRAPGPGKVLFGWGMDPHKIHAFFKSLFFLFLFTAISFSSFAQTRPRLAILPFTGGTEGDGETIAELFSYENELARNFTIIPRTSSIEAIMKEQQFQRSSGLTDADTIARLGRQANAAYVVAGHIQNLGASKLVLITIIHVESLRQIAGDYKAYKNIEEVQALIPAMAKRISAASRLNAANLPRLAVFPFGIFASGVNQEDAEVLAQLLATEIANSGKYAVLPRTGAIQSVIEEQKIQRSAITEPHNIKTIGNALNAQYVLAGNVRRLGSTNLFTASILQVEDASQITGNAANYNAIGDGLSKMAELSNSLIAVGMSIIPEGFVLVEGGAFQMGSNNGDSDEKPVHTVRVGSFLIGKYEVTQKEWIEIMKSNPSNFKGYNLPVENITWYEAVEYCNKRSRNEGLTPAYRGNGDSISCDFTVSGYRLPTEAEWEYAAKGGINDFMPYEYPGENSDGGTPLARTKAPNSLGIYDMNGSIWEWCWDWYGSYSSESQTDPRGASSGIYRVTRGGKWGNSAQILRSADRNYFTPSGRSITAGLRLVRP